VQGTWYKCILALVFKHEFQPLSLLSTACILWFGAGKSIILQSCTELNKSKILKYSYPKKLVQKFDIPSPASLFLHFRLLLSLHGDQNFFYFLFLRAYF